MKRLRIWISGFSLLQQFLAIGFFMIVLFVVFSATYLHQNINSFINGQMLHYLHRSQEEFLLYQGNNRVEDVNAYHFLVNTQTYSIVEGVIEEDLMDVVYHLSYPEERGSADGFLEYRGYQFLYFVQNLGGEMSAVSLLKESYRIQYQKALFDSVVNVTMLLIFLLFLLMVVWIFTLLRPLSQIKYYIDGIREGREVSLKLSRGDEIGEVAEALVDMQSELSRQQQIREEMIQNISHDLKTPIATIKSYSESIKDGVYPYDTLEKSVDVIFEHANRLEKKVYSLITYNRMGYLMDNQESTSSADMMDIVQKAIVAVQVLRNEIRIETDLQRAYFHGESDPWRIVVENLLDNALRYAHSVVRIHLSDQEMSVFNDGKNMPQERIEKLFKPYEKGTGGNFGLGLSIVKRVCDTYGFAVRGENTNDGVIFRVLRLSKEKKSRAKK